MKLRFFDFEVYPNWWCVTFGDFPEGELTSENRWTFINESVKDNFFCIDSDDPRAREKVIQ